MTITATQTQGNGVLNDAVGRHLDDAATPAALVVTLGFTPRTFRLINLTDRIELSWFEGMAANSAYKRIADGTGTLVTSAAVTVSGDTVTVAAANILQNKQYSWVATG